MCIQCDYSTEKENKYGEMSNAMCRAVIECQSLREVLFRYFFKPKWTINWALCVFCAGFVIQWEINFLPNIFDRTMLLIMSQCNDSSAPKFKKKFVWLYIYIIDINIWKLVSHFTPSKVHRRTENVRNNDFTVALLFRFAFSNKYRFFRIRLN